MFQCVEVKPDSNDIFESTHNEKPSTGMFAVSYETGPLLLICHSCFLSWQINDLGR